MSDREPDGLYAEVWHDGITWCWHIRSDGDLYPPAWTCHALTRWGARRQAARRLRQDRKAAWLQLKYGREVIR